jgi:hypothetical protein
VRQLQKDVVRQMLGKEDRPLPAAGWAEIETLAGKRPEVGVPRMHGRAGAYGTDQPALRVRAADPRHALKIVATGAKLLPDLLDTLKAIPAIGGGVLLIVPGAEVAEVPLEYSMELVAAARNVPIPCRGRDRDCCAHINIYWQNGLAASDRGCGHRAPHNTYKDSPCQEGTVKWPCLFRRDAEAI